DVELDVDCFHYAVGMNIAECYAPNVLKAESQVLCYFLEQCCAFWPDAPHFLAVFRRSASIARLKTLAIKPIYSSGFDTLTLWGIAVSAHQKMFGAKSLTASAHRAFLAPAAELRASVLRRVKQSESWRFARSL